MDLPEIKKLDEIIKLCRKRGVKSFRMGEMEITLGDAEVAPARGAAKPAAETPKAFVQGDLDANGWEKLSPEEQMFYSVGGVGSQTASDETSGGA
jgi:hypothetical protein